MSKVNECRWLSEMRKAYEVKRLIRVGFKLKVANIERFIFG